MLNMLHLAGRQIVPNAQATLAAARARLLRRLVVLHSDNERESAGPARQFFQLLTALGDLMEPVRPELGEVEESALAVYHTALEILEEPLEHRWVLHASGGTKLMSTGLMLLARHPRVAAVVYRDLHRGWFRFRLNAQGQPEDQAISAGCPELGWLLQEQVRVSSWPLIDVLQSQLGAEGAQAKSRALPSKVQAFDWLDYGCKRPGFFHQFPAVARLGLEEGNAFEALLALMLKEAGCEQVLWGVEFEAEDGSKLLESDVVACHGDQIVLFDVKIQRGGSWAREKSGQIRNASKTAEALGGLSAKAVLVRPNWPASPSVGEIANALRVPLIRRTEVGTLLDEMLKPLRLANAQTPALQACRQRLEQHARRAGAEAFIHNPPVA
jgi:hypothetical protein